MDEQIQRNESNFQVVVAILIALATVLGAFLAWRASVVADAAGDADFTGLRASTFAAEARSLNYVNAYEHYGMYIKYLGHSLLGAQLKEKFEATEASLSEEESQWRARQIGEAFDLAKASLHLFPARYMDRDENYNVKREMGENWADAAKEQDLNPTPLYAEADRLRTKTNLILGMISILGIGLVFYTLVEIAPDRLKVFLLAVGSIFVVAATAYGLYVDFLVK